MCSLTASCIFILTNKNDDEDYILVRLDMIIRYRRTLLYRLILNQISM